MLLKLAVCVTAILKAELLPGLYLLDVPNTRPMGPIPKLFLLLDELLFLKSTLLLLKKKPGVKTISPDL